MIYDVNDEVCKVPSPQQRINNNNGEYYDHFDYLHNLLGIKGRKDKSNRKTRAGRYEQFKKDCNYLNQQRDLADIGVMNTMWPKYIKEFTLTINTIKERLQSIEIYLQDINPSSKSDRQKSIPPFKLKNADFSIKKAYNPSKIALPEEQKTPSSVFPHIAYPTKQKPPHIRKSQIKAINTIVSSQSYHQHPHTFNHS